MTRISTHVLDTARGTPAGALSVHLERRSGTGEWLIIRSAQTDADGRCTQLLPDGENLAPGIYRLAFDTETYFTSQGQQTFYPIVRITFSVREGETDFHIPLLLSAYGYTTYRGT
jgi:5-hydroxyisourate hydrolase